MINLIVKNNQGIVFQGEVTNITCYNKKGIFNILQDHANMITLVDASILINQNGQMKEIAINNGILKNLGNKTVVYIGVK